MGDQCERRICQQEWLTYMSDARSKGNLKDGAVFADMNTQAHLLAATSLHSAYTGFPVTLASGIQGLPSNRLLHELHHVSSFISWIASCMTLLQISSDASFS